MKTFKLLSFAVLAMAISLASCSGEDGERGPQGLAGEDGADGINGTNGVDGQDGQNGVDGQDKPNVDFYFQDGFKAYEGTQDAQISDTFGDSNDIMTSVANFGDPSNDAYTVMRFDGISEIITGSIVGEGQSCAEAFYMNQAILYIYVDAYETDASSLSFQLGFYNEDDPLFAQNDASWGGANQVQVWGGGDGGLSSQWIGPFPETDNYGVAYPFTGASANKPGWYAIPLPRGVVSEWICNESANKGFRIRLAINGGTYGITTFLSSDNLSEDLRPVLVIETEKIDSQSGKGSVSNTKTKDWESMSYEEKMAPLHQYLEMKKSN